MKKLKRVMDYKTPNMNDGFTFLFQVDIISQVSKTKKLKIVID